MARVIIPNTEEFLKNYAGTAYGKKIYAPDQTIERISKLVGFVDKMAESPAMTVLASGVKAAGEKLGGALEGMGTELRRQREMEENRPVSPGPGMMPVIPGTATVGPEGIGGYDPTVGMSMQEKQAYAAMTPEQRMKYAAAKRRAQVTAEQTDFERAKTEMMDARGDFLRMRETQTSADKAAAAAEAEARKQAGVSLQGYTQQQIEEAKRAKMDPLEANQINRARVIDKLYNDMRGMVPGSQELKDTVAQLEKMNAEHSAEKAVIARIKASGGYDVLSPEQKQKVVKFAEDMKKRMEERIMPGIRLEQAMAGGAAVPKEMPATAPVSPTPAAPPVFSVPGAPVATAPAAAAPAARPAPPATATTQVPTPVYPEGQVGAGPPTFTGAEDYLKRMREAKDDKERMQLINELAANAVAMTAASGTEAVPATQATPYPAVERTQMRPELAERAKLGLEERGISPEDADLMTRYGLDKAGVERYKFVAGLGVEPEPGQEPYTALKTTEDVMGAARMADTPEKQQMVLQAVRNLEFRPKNVFEAFGFGQTDPERRLGLGKAVVDMFPKKTAQDTYYDLLLKQEQARAKAEASATAAAKRPGEVAKGEAEVRRTDVATAAQMEQARATAAKTRTEDYLRQAKLDEKIGKMANDIKRAQAALVAARRPRGGGGLTFAQRVSLQDQTGLANDIVRNNQTAKDLDAQAANMDKIAGYKADANQKAQLERDAKYTPPAKVKTKEKPAVDAAVKKASEARRQLSEIQRREQDAKAAADAAKGLRDRANEHRRRAEDSLDIYEKTYPGAGAVQKRKEEKREPEKKE